MEQTVYPVYPAGHFGFPAHVDEAPPIATDKPSLMTTERETPFVGRFASHSATDPVAMTRRCTGCRTVKPLDQFHRDKYAPFGRKYYCAVCMNERQRSA